MITTVNSIGETVRRLLSPHIHPFKTSATAGKAVATLIPVIALVMLTMFLVACGPEEVAATTATPKVNTVQDSATSTVTTEATPTPTPAPTKAQASPVPDSQPATVIGVIDGDTIEVEINGQAYRIRYIGIDTPEQGQAYGAEAGQANSDLVAGKTVILVKDVSETDQFDRLLRYVYLEDGTFVNAELVMLGYATAVAYPPDTLHHEEFVQLEQDARGAGRGIWAAATETPVLPTNTPVPQPTSTSEPAAPTQTPVPVPTNTEAPPPPAAGGQIVITGVDKRAEYVDLTNVGGQAVNLSGWVLVSEKGNQACGLGGEIPPGATLRVWALASDAGQGGYNCGFGNTIWNNSESDPAALYDNSGQLVDRYP